MFSHPRSRAVPCSGSKIQACWPVVNSSGVTALFTTFPMSRACCEPKVKFVNLSETLKEK